MKSLEFAFEITWPLKDKKKRKINVYTDSKYGHLTIETKNKSTKKLIYHISILYFLDLTTFKGKGRNTKIFSLVFGSNEKFRICFRD